MLAKERRERLLAEMRREGLEAIVVYGTSGRKPTCATYPTSPSWKATASRS